jgi:DNA-directed RNA polymerase specialized sigma24 family protein
MARHKLTDHARRLHAACRDQRREATGDEAFAGVAGGDATPSRILAGRELLRQVQDRLSAEERYLAEQRALGREWADLAAELGCNADALRVRLRRALARVTDELDPDGSCLR